MSRSPLLAALVLALTLGPLAACGATVQATGGTGTAASPGIVLHHSGTKGGRCALTSHTSGGKGGRFVGSKPRIRAHTGGGCAIGGRDTGAALTSHKLAGSVG